MGALSLVVTGAGGRLGRAVLEEALTRGHRVRALLRRDGTALPEGAEPVLCDLAEPGPQLARALRGADAVLHLAGALTGDEARHVRDTIAATRALYRALPAAGRVVLAGSMAVYQGRAGPVDEHSPLEPELAARDAYARAKAAQEEIAREHAARAVATTVLRIGALVGPGSGRPAWRAHLGLFAGPLCLRLAGSGEVPLVGLGDAARALVLAAERPPPGKIEVFNILAPDLPDARAALAALPPGARPALTLPLPWRLLLPAALVARALRLRVPGLLRPATLRYRFAPRCYSNARACAALGWRPEKAVP